MKSLEIFSGAGGMAKGLEMSGFEHAAFVECSRHACASLRLNFDAAKLFAGDIRDYDFSQLTDVDVVAGGPPCQPFSLGGKHGASADDRDMFPYAAKATELLTPKAFVFENVKGLLRQSFSNYFEYIVLRLTYPKESPAPRASWQDHLAELKSISYPLYYGTKYKVDYALLNAADYGVPQVRERVVLVGLRADCPMAWSFPQATHSLDKLMWDQHVTGSYWDRHKISFKRAFAGIDSIDKRTMLLRKFGMLEPTSLAWATVRDALHDVPDPRESHGIPDHIFRDGARSYPGHTGSDFDLPAKTIKAGGHGVPGGENMLRYADGSVRYFTVYEAKKLQTFPDNFVITGAWGEALRQIGNAVPVTLAYKIGSALFALLRQADRAAGVPASPLICGLP